MINRDEICLKQKLTCSVAMTTYNREKYVVQQMSSIMHQSHAVDEVIIIDDGSQDDTVQIIQDFISKNFLLHWTLICNERNLGYTKNFEKCISKCHGDVIPLCNQDDVWYLEKVSKIIKVFESCEDYLSVAANFQIIDSKSDRITHTEEKDNCWCYSKKRKFISDHLYQVDVTEVLNHNISPGCTQALRKELVNEFLCNRYNTIHDYRITLHAALNGYMNYLDLPLVLYRVHENNSVGYPDYCLMRKRIKILKSILYIFIICYTSRCNWSITEVKKQMAQ